MTDQVTTQVGAEVLYSVLPQQVVTQVGAEVLYGAAQNWLKVQVAWDPQYTGVTQWSQPYADVTDRVLRCDVQRSAGLPDFGPDHCMLRLQNNDLRFTPGNATSPLYGLLPIDPVDGRPVRVLGVWQGTQYALFYGYLRARTVELSQTATGRTMDFEAQSPLQLLAPLGVQIGPFPNVVPASGTPFYTGMVEHLVTGANSAIYLKRGRAELNDAFTSAPLGGDTAVAVDLTFMAQYGPFSNLVAGLEGLSIATGGTYFVRPLVQSADGDFPYVFVWQPLSAKENAPDDLTVVDTDGDLEYPVFDERAPAGL